MACNSCAKPFTLFRKEKGCPGCGFSYCSKCLDNKLFLEKINAEAKVCTKCKNSAGKIEKKKIDPPDAYLKKVGIGTCEADNSSHSKEETNDLDQEIKHRLQNLREDQNKVSERTTDEAILKRLQNIKGTQPTTSDAELQSRLANLRGIPVIDGQKQTILCAPDLRTEQEQADDLMRQYLEHVNIDKQYQEGFIKQIDDIEARIQKLKGTAVPDTSKTSTIDDTPESEDEDTIIKKIIEKVKVESTLPDEELPASTNDELPFCEICNEDARMRCLGCRYLFCKQCFLEHKDDDDGCDRYEPYEAPKNS